METITFRLKPGQLLKEEIEKKAIDENIEAGVLLSIVGALNKVNLRMAGAKPGSEVIKNYEDSFEIVSGTGTISKNGCHIHISVSGKDGSVIGGHLKDGCIVEVTAEIVLGIIKNVKYNRIMDEETGYKELTVE